jgi:hypothetical protein
MVHGGVVGFAYHTKSLKQGNKRNSHFIHDSTHSRNQGCKDEHELA